MGDLDLELEIKLKQNQVLDRFESDALAVARKVEQSFKDMHRIRIDRSELTKAIAALKEANREADKLSKSRGFKIPSTQSAQRSNGSSGRSQSGNAQHIKELREIERIEKQVAAARVKAASSSKEKEQAKILQEVVRHARALENIKLKIIDPQAAVEAARLERALHGINVGRIKSEFANADKAVVKSMSSMQKTVQIALGNILANAAAFSVGAITRGVGAIGSAAGDSIKKSMQLGSDLNTIEALGGLTPQQTKEMESVGEKLMTTYGKVRQEVNAVAIDLAQAGIQQEKLKGFTEDTLQLMTATRSQQAEATGSLIKLTNGFNLSSNQAKDILAQGANRSVGGLSDVDTSLQYVGNSAQKMGIQADELIGYINLLRGAGLEASRVGTGLDAAFRNIPKNAEVFEKLGFEIFDLNGKLKQGQDLFNAIADGMTKLSDKQKIELFTKGFDKDGVAATEIIGRIRTENRSRFDEEMQAMKRNAGVAEETSKKMLDDPTKKADIFLRKLEILQEKAGQAFASGVEAAIEFGNQVADALIANDDLFKEINQAATEFSAYLKEHPELVQETVQFLEDMVGIIGGTILDLVQEWVRFTADNKTAYEGLLKTISLTANALTGIADIGRTLVGIIFELVNTAAEVGIAIANWSNPLNAALATAKAFNAESVKATAMQGGVASGVSQGVIGGGNNQVEVSQEQMYQLAALAIAESPTREGRTDVAQAVFNRVNAGGYGSNVTDVAFAPGQFEPYFGVSPSQTATRDGAIAFLQSRGYSRDQAIAALDQTIGDVSNPSMMANSAQHVGGRTSFKGTTQYQHMVQGEDRLRSQGENFYHIDSGQSYDQLAQLQRQSPSSIVVAGTRASGYEPPDRVLNQESSSSANARARSASSVPSDLSERADAAIAEAQKKEEVRVAPVGVRTLPVQQYGADRPGRPGGHRGEDLDVAAGQNSVSYLGGEVIEIQDWGKDGLAAVIHNAQLGVTEIVAEFSHALVNVGDRIAAGAEVGSGANEVTGVSHVEIHQGRGRTGQNLDPLEYYRQVGADPSTGRVYGGDEQHAYRVSQGMREDADQDRKRKEEEAKKERERLRNEQRNNEDDARQMQRDRMRRERESANESQRLEAERAAVQFEGTDFAPLFERQNDRMRIDADTLEELITAQERLEDLQIQRQRLNDEDRSKQPAIAGVSTQLDAAINAEREYVDQLEKRREAQLTILNERSAKEDEEFRRSIQLENEDRNRANATRELSSAQQAYLATLENDSVRAFESARLGAVSMQQEFENATAQSRSDVEQLEDVLTQFESAGGDMSSERVTALKDRLASLREEIQSLDSEKNVQIEISMSIARRELENAVKDIQEGLRDRIQNNIVDKYRRRGDEYGARRLETGYAQSRLSSEYERDRADIESYRGVLGDDRTNSMLGDRLEAYKQESDALKESLSAIGQIMPDLASGFSQLFVTAFTNFDQLGQVALQVFNSIIAKMLEMAAMQIFSDLFGLGGSAIGGAGMLSPSTGATAVLGIAAKGGMLRHGELDRELELRGSGAIASAMQRERMMSGHNPVLAVVNDRELILSAEQTQRFKQQNLAPLVMAGGNLGSVAPLMNFARGGDTFNLPINYAPGSDRTDGESLMRIMRQVAIETIERQRRPGGRLAR